MKNFLLGSCLLSLIACGQGEAPEPSSVVFASNGFDGEGMAFAFFVGPETKAIDSDFDGVDDSEETQFVLSISDKANFCDVLTVDPNVAELTDLKLATMKVFIQGDIGTTALIVAGATLSEAPPEVQLAPEFLIKEAGELVFLGNSVSGSELSIDAISGTDASGAWSDELEVDLITASFINAPISANVPSALPCEALDAFFR